MDEEHLEALPCFSQTRRSRPIRASYSFTESSDPQSSALAHENR